MTKFRWTGSAALGGLISPANEFWDPSRKRDSADLRRVHVAASKARRRRCVRPGSRNLRRHSDRCAAECRRHGARVGRGRKCPEGNGRMGAYASQGASAAEGSFAFSSAPFQPFSGRGRCWSPKGNANINIQAYLNWVGATGELRTLGREVFNSQSLPRQQLSYRFRILRSARFFGLRNSAPVGVRPAVLFV